MDINLISLVVGLISSGLIEGAKRVQSVPLNSGQTAKLRIVLAVLVLGGNALNAYLNGNLADFTASEQVNVLVNSLVSGLVAHLSFKLGIKKLS